MELREFAESWEQYGLRKQGGQSNEPLIPLTELYFFCLGPHDEGVEFDGGGQQGSATILLKPINGKLWLRTSEGSTWTCLGDLEPLVKENP